MPKMDSLSDETQLPLGVKLHLGRVVKEGDTVRRIELIFDNGVELEFSIHSYNILTALVTAKPKMVDMWRVSGKIKQSLGDFKVLSYFDREGDASDFVDGLMEKHPGAHLSIKLVQMEEEKAKEVDNDEIPF